MKSRSLAVAAGLLSVLAISAVTLPIAANTLAPEADPIAAALAAAAAEAPTAAAPAAAPAAAAAGPVIGNAEAGAAKAAVCSACHGVGGNSVNPEWPNLAAQHPEYTAQQLKLFRAMVRTNPIMQAQAVALTDQDIADLAAYYRQQTQTGLEADPSLVEAGEQLWRAGDATRGIPSCKACHGPGGLGNGPAMWPLVRGQHSLYTYNQLKNYANRARYVAVQGQPSPPAQAEMMYDIASRMTDEDMRAVASFIQGLR